jgi:hypothetical protein
VSPSPDSSDEDIPELTDIMVTGRDSHDQHDQGDHRDPHAKAKRAKPHARRHGHHAEAHEEAHVEPAPVSADDDDIPVLDSLYESPAPAPTYQPAQFVPGEAEFTSGSAAEHYVAPYEPARASAHATPATTDYDADILAERLRGRFSTYLKGEGRNLIEARCRDAFQDHTTWLVNQITREVALALEAEMVSWVREAIREELVKHAADK